GPHPQRLYLAAYRPLGVYWDVSLRARPLGNYRDASAQCSAARHVPDVTLPGQLLDFDPIALDDRVREQLVGDFGRQHLGLRRFGRRQVELEVLALPNVLDAAVAERMQRVDDGPALRVEDGRLEGDKDTR